MLTNVPLYVSAQKSAPMCELFSNEKALKTVRALVQFCRIGEIDTMNEKYWAEVYIECKWVEQSSELSPGCVYDPKSQWNPELFIDNALNLSYENVKYRVIKINENLFEITEIRQIKG